MRRKRFLAFLLALVLAFSSVGAMDVSATPNTVEDDGNTEDIQTPPNSDANIELRNEEEGYSWICTDETLTVQVLEEDLKNTIVQLGYVTDGEDPESFVEFSPDVREVLSDYDQDNGILTFYGEKIPELEEVRELGFFCVRIEVPKVNPEDENEDNDDVWPFIIVEPRIEYDYPCSFPGSDTMLVKEEIYIDHRIWSWGANVDYPFGHEEDAIITNIEVTEQYSYVEDKDVESGIVDIVPDGDGWVIKGLDHGRAKITLTIEDWFHDEDVSYSFEVHSIGEYYELRLYYPDDTDCVLPGGEKEIYSELIRRFIDEDNNHCEESVEDYTLSYVGEEDTTVDAVEKDEMTFGINDKVLTVKAKEEAEGSYESIQVRASYTHVWEEDGERKEEVQTCDTTLNMNCTDNYQAFVMDDIENIEIGDTIDIKDHIHWYQYESGSDDVRDLLVDDPEHYRVKLEWSEEWEKAYEADESLAPVLRRVKPDGTEIIIIGQRYDKENGEWVDEPQRNEWFDGLDYSIWMENVPDDGRDWLYADEDFIFTLNTENVEGKDNLNVIFLLEKEVEEEWLPLDEPAYSLEEKDGKIVVTLHGDEIKKQLGEDNDYFEILYVVCFQNGENEDRVYYDWRGMHLRENWADYEFPENEEWISLLLGDGYYISREASVEYEDKDHPHRDWSQVEVKDVEILRQRAYTEDGAVATAKSIVSLNEDENGWYLEGIDHGEADFRIVFTNIYGDEEEHVFTVSSAGEQMELKLDTQDDRIRVTPGSETRVDAKIVRRYIDEKDNQHKEILDISEMDFGPDEEGNPILNYEDHLAEYSISEDGQAIIIKAKEDVGGDNWFHVRAYEHQEDSEEFLYECWGDYILEVNEEVYTFKFNDLSAIDSMLNVGEKVDLRKAGPELEVQRVGEDSRIMGSDEVYFSIEDWDENAWTEVERENEDSIALLERTGTWETDLWLVARRCENDEEIARYRFTFSGVEIGFRNLRGGDWTWVFEDEGDYRLDLNMNALASADDISVEWAIGDQDDEGNFIENTDISWAKISKDDSQEKIDDYMENHHYVIDEDGMSIHLNGCKLVEDFKNEENGYIRVQTIVKVKGKEVYKLVTHVELRENYYRLEGEDNSELLHMKGSGWVYEQNTIGAYVECGAYPYGKDVTLYIEDIDLHNHDEENPAFTLYSDRYSGYWNIYANRPGGANAIFTVSHGRIGTFKVEKELYTSDEIYMLHAYSDNGSHMLLPGEELQLVTDFYLYERDEKGDVVETYIPDDQYEVIIWADDPELVDCDSEDKTIKAFNSMGGTNVHVKVNFTNKYGEEDSREFPLWIDVQDYIMAVESETYYARPNSIQDIDKFNINIVEKFIDENGMVITNTYAPDKVKFTDVGNVNYFWITWWQQKLAVNNKITRELPMVNRVQVAAEYDGGEFDGWVNVVVCDHEYEKVTEKSEENATITYDYCDKCGHVSNYKEFALSQTSYTYNGQEQKPAVTVKDMDGNEMESKYYAETYPEGCKNAGTYKVTISFKGEYSGSEVLSYKINAKKITPSVTLSKTSYTYNGKVQTPTITVKDGSTKLKANTDYTVSYSSGRKNVGKYTVTVTLKGNYSGKKSVTYTIIPKGTSISKATAASKSFKLTWKKQATQIDGYQIQYSTSSKFTGAKSVSVKGATKTSTIVKKLTGKKKYYVRLRTYKKVSGVTYYSSWSSPKSVTTKK